MLLILEPYLKSMSVMKMPGCMRHGVEVRCRMRHRVHMTAVTVVIDMSLRVGDVVDVR
jgi:hypothetical protein